MIQKLILKNFRNFTSQEFLFVSRKNMIIGENGHWKTNILEALSLFSGHSLSGLDFNTLVKQGQEYFYIEVLMDCWDTLSLHYDIASAKKTYQVNKKTSSKPKMLAVSYTTVHFSPIIMNMMYLWPTLRRDFLDTMLKHSFSEYTTLLKKYKEILKNRNQFLKSIAAGHSLKKDISFWDDRFIELAASIYAYRFHVTQYLSDHIDMCQDFFWENKKQVQFLYISKVNKLSIAADIQASLRKNIDRDIILWKTNIGPHIDDFSITLDGTPLTDFASRWEVKSTIIALKILEAKFIEYKTEKKPLLLIDDLLSELDHIHTNYLFDRIGEYQSAITSIYWKFEGENSIEL